MNTETGACGWKVEKIVKKGDYLYAVVHGHPNATKHGYVLYHRIQMENHLGRLLLPSEIVHHKNENRKDNRVENLEVMNASEHARLHGKKRGKEMVVLKCPHCGKIFERRRGNTHLVKGGIFTSCSNVCRGKFSHLVKLSRRTAAVELAISENIVREEKHFPNDDSEETEATGSVETIRQSSETTKI